jgi:hypothetical protein
MVGSTSIKFRFFCSFKCKKPIDVFQLFVQTIRILTKLFIYHDIN